MTPASFALPPSAPPIADAASTVPLNACDVGLEMCSLPHAGRGSSDVPCDAPLLHANALLDTTTNGSKDAEPELLEGRIAKAYAEKDFATTPLLARTEQLPSYGIVTKTADDAMQLALPGAEARDATLRTAAKPVAELFPSCGDNKPREEACTYAAASHFILPVPRDSLEYYDARICITASAESRTSCQWTPVPADAVDSPSSQSPASQKRDPLTTKSSVVTESVSTNNSGNTATALELCDAVRETSLDLVCLTMADKERFASNKSAANANVDIPCALDTCIQTRVPVESNIAAVSSFTGEDDMPQSSEPPRLLDMCIPACSSHVKILPSKQNVLIKAFKAPRRVDRVGTKLEVPPNPVLHQSETTENGCDRVGERLATNECSSASFLVSDSLLQQEATLAQTMSDSLGLPARKSRSVFTGYETRIVHNMKHFPQSTADCEGVSSIEGVNSIMPSRSDTRKDAANADSEANGYNCLPPACYDDGLVLSDYCDTESVENTRHGIEASDAQQSCDQTAAIQLPTPRLRKFGFQPLRAEVTAMRIITEPLLQVGDRKLAPDDGPALKKVRASN